MKMKLLPVLAVLATTLTGTAHAADAVYSSRLEQSSRVESQVMHPSAADKEYERRLAEYRKDLAAYEADPSIWTVEVPVLPVKPATTANAEVGKKG